MATEKIKINIPAQIDIKVLILNDETGQMGYVTIGTGVGGHMKTDEEIMQRIREFSENEIQNAAPGFRVATNREFFEAQLIEKAGTNRLHVPGVEYGESLDPDQDDTFFADFEFDDFDEA